MGVWKTPLPKICISGTVEGPPLLTQKKPTHLHVDRPKLTVEVGDCISDFCVSGGPPVDKKNVT